MNFFWCLILPTHVIGLFYRIKPNVGIQHLFGRHRIRVSKRGHGHPIDGLSGVYGIQYVKCGLKRRERLVWRYWYGDDHLVIMSHIRQLINTWLDPYSSWWKFTSHTGVVQVNVTNHPCVCTPSVPEHPRKCVQKGLVRGCHQKSHL